MTEEQTPNPLLERLKMPGETFRLPSRGLFYKSGEIETDSPDGEIHVHPMTTYDEFVFKNVDKLFTGTAVEDVFGRLMPEVKHPTNLLSKDVDFLMMALRVVSYGDELEIQFNHQCGTEEAPSNVHSYYVNLRQLMKDTKEIDPTEIKNFKVELNNGQVVLMQPPRFADILKIYQASDNAENMEDIDYVEMMLDNISGMIVSVDDIDDSNMIGEWLRKLRAGDVNRIAEEITTVSDWGAERFTVITCKDCNEDKIRVEVPINPITFFT